MLQGGSGGNVTVVEPQTGVPFAVVANLFGDQKFSVENIEDIDTVREELTKKIEERFGLNSMHVVRIDGFF